MCVRLFGSFLSLNQRDTNVKTVLGLYRLSNTVLERLLYFTHHYYEQYDYIQFSSVLILRMLASDHVPQGWKYFQVQNFRISFR